MTNIYLNNAVGILSASTVNNITTGFLSLSFAIELVAEKIKESGDSWISATYILEKIDNIEEELLKNNFSYCKKDTWDEMSYNQYNQGLLDFSYSEYSDGDWNND